jgi:hypothetical protein
MASNINANNIDGAFPVAGQDNDSQGFRDNFTNAKNNFSYAKSEIEDLQSKVLLKTALSGDILSNALNDTVLSGAQVLDFSETRVALGTTSGTVTLDHTLGHYQTVTTNGNVTLAFSNLPPAGQRGRIRLQIVIANVAHTLTLPAAVSLGTNQLQGYSSNVITFAATGTYEFEFTTDNAGTAITIFDMSRSGLGGSEDLANAGAASLTKTSSYFTTGNNDSVISPETGTLAAGTNGQVKTFAAVDVSLGDMVITVTNAGWKSIGTGTITFDSDGQACTLQYINAKWFCIGNNGATFA